MTHYGPPLQGRSRLTAGIAQATAPTFASHRNPPLCMLAALAAVASAMGNNLRGERLLSMISAVWGGVRRKPPQNTGVPRPGVVRGRRRL